MSTALQKNKASAQPSSAPILISSLDERDFLKVKVFREIRDLEKKIKDHKSNPDEISDLLYPSWISLLKCKIKVAKSLKELNF